MTQSNVAQPAVGQQAAAGRLSAASNVYAAYIGLDVHKATIAVSVA
ncbi:hypothetical protein HPA02_30670 [Bisbaumannia pacifica]|uniref:Uncharacterized protein n=1 Tax=Bisbaumannia pacifica TaxID=77098 RepID=A0A510XBF7_9GAMM|nr:hypothetical protein HPA02_30670 [Halomonas pacifica]